MRTAGQSQASCREVATVLASKFNCPFVTACGKLRAGICVDKPRSKPNR